MFNWLTDRFWRFVFWWKQRTGFLVFGPVIATGTVLSLRSSSDGDALINIQLDDDCLHLTPVGIGRASSHGKLHCELVPWIRGAVREAYATLQVGDRVRLVGDWGFDGVHLYSARTKSWRFLVEVLGAIVRHQPNVQDGWFEIHPVRQITKLPGS